jgi:hypothetical protein
MGRASNRKKLRRQEAFRQAVVAEICKSDSLSILRRAA